MNDARLHRARTRIPLLIAAATSVAALSLFASPEEALAPLGDFAHHQDIGAPKIAGSATWNAASQEYRLTAAGVNLWGKRDEFHFAWRRLTGDFILQVRVELVGAGVDPHRKAGLARERVARRGLALRRRGGPRRRAHVAAVPAREGQGSPSRSCPSTKGADFLQLERRGNRFTMSAARFGEPLTVSALEELPLGDEVYVGLFLCSHNVDVVEQAIFRDVRIIRPAKADFTPYRDYIGSVLEILDVETGRRQVVRRSAEPFEAPNWTTDGGALIYNSSGRGEGRGRLHRFDLATRHVERHRHAASRSATTTTTCCPSTAACSAISDQSQDEGRSTVYTLPTAGGAPRRITPLTPSYLHGWSPDGKWLVYTGGRNGEFDIYKRASDGSGEETAPHRRSRASTTARSTVRTASYIYFNSVRSGTMQIWRMKPDGKDPEPVTNDEYNNWFPHLSPDGKQIAFLSYGSDVAPAEHPYYKQVYAAADAGRGRRAARDRVRLRRAGHDQRAVVVARRDACSPSSATATPTEHGLPQRARARS